MTMDALLNEFYQTSQTTASASQNAEAEKVAEAAQVDLFLKLAADNQVDIAGMMETAEGQAKVNAYWERFQKEAAAAAEFEVARKAAGTKTASADPHAGEEAKEVEARKLLQEAEKEHAEKRAAAIKIAEADFCGRVMAHAMVNEMRAIQSGGETNKQAEAAASKVAEFPFPMKGKDDKDKGDDKGPPPPDKKKDDKDDEKKAGVSAAVLRGLERAKTAAAPVAPPTQVKKASTIDQLAAEQAVLKIAEHLKASGASPEQIQAGAEEAANKIAALDTLGQIKESTKIASAADVQEAIHVRSFELLEQIGVAVNWQ